jgi:hypothetical protein
MLVRLYSAAPVSLHGTQYTSDHNTPPRLSFVLNIDCNVVKMCFSERYAAVCIPSETPSKERLLHIPILGPIHCRNNPGSPDASEII